MEKNINKIAAMNFVAELAETLEEVLDKRSQYGRPSVDEALMLKRCRYLADLLEQALKADQGNGPEAA